MKTLIIVLGPTASGKSDVAFSLAKQFECEIISSDSRQIFRELEIGSAPPSKQMQNQIKHHFVQTRSVTENYNAWQFEMDAINLLENDIFLRKDIAIMVGGSMMYIDAVCKGIDFLPDADPKIRLQVKEELDKFGIEHLQEEVKKCDPEYFQIVDLKNPMRLQKAIEIFRQTGKPYSSFRTGEGKKRNFRIIKIGINMDRILLHNRINQRVDKMIEMGLVEEVKKLIPYKNLTSLNTVGYREIFEYFGNKHDLNTAIELIKRNTRRYARKQITWFKKDSSTKWFDAQNFNEILGYLKEKLNIA